MDAPIQFLHDLVAIDSVNPDLVPGCAGEAAVAQYIAETLSRAGLDVRLQEVVPGRPNVIARARGTCGGRTLILNLPGSPKAVRECLGFLAPALRECLKHLAE